MLILRFSMARLFGSSWQFRVRFTGGVFDSGVGGWIDMIMFPSLWDGRAGQGRADNMQS